ncbi:glutathione S-transferase [Alphaproteobacteria bacterium GH1-50]|uniref:Glutathione S-transferase n=1 Tax=Kangsaoukella pontilimi TaxID=2691042 RepID=A0A7C9IQK2_9RHOB|nr:glutathione S-transferase family protein [Kangsaoukella pontilimi]MXQ07783.1 glutathione S-transferase [Kangsaoukella pontilimi]
MIVLHHAHQTRSMRVLWLLYELGVEFELRVRPFDRTLRNEEFLSLSPAGRVPALEIGGEVLFESTAILQVLTTRFPEAGLGRMPGDPDWPDWLVWLNFAETLSQHVAALTQQHVALYEDHMRSPVVMRLEAARARKCFEAIEARLSTPVENRDTLLTAGFSAADVAVGQAVYMALHFVRADEFPALSAWYDSLSARPAFRKSLPGPADERLYARAFYEPWDG